MMFSRVLSHCLTHSFASWTFAELLKVNMAMFSFANRPNNHNFLSVSRPQDEDADGSCREQRVRFISTIICYWIEALMRFALILVCIPTRVRQWRTLFSSFHIDVFKFLTVNARVSTSHYEMGLCRVELGHTDEVKRNFEKVANLWIFARRVSASSPSDRN